VALHNEFSIADGHTVHAASSAINQQMDMLDKIVELLSVLSSQHLLCAFGLYPSKVRQFISALGSPI
jgi:hypothetical protein